MKIVSYLVLMIFVSSIVIAQNDQPPADQAFASISKIFNQPGKAQPDGTQKYTWPRKDLAVTANGVQIEPSLALGSWAAFKKIAQGQMLTMGDLVLLPAEINPVIRQLQSGGLDILAVHNHLFGESPELVYVHFMGRGNPEQLANALKDGLSRTKTPMDIPKPPTTAAVIEKDFETIQDVIGKKGNISGKVLQINVPRKETIKDDGEEIPSGMGMAIAMNFQLASENRVASTGDFVLIADEVNPVIKELQSHGIDVTALHTHMLHDSPHLFFMHFWALDTSQKVAEGLKAALARVNVK